MHRGIAASPVGNTNHQPTATKGVFEYRIQIRIHTESGFRFSEKVHSNNESESGFKFGKTGLQLQIH